MSMSGFGLIRAAKVGAIAGLLAAAPGFAGGAAQARGAPDSFADLAEALSPTVVNISTSQMLKRPKSDVPTPQFPEGSPLEEFFKEFMERDQNAPRRVTSLGSGFVFDPSGYIVTNNHVIEGADQITVNFNDGSSLPADIVGRDSKTDLALLRVKPKTALTAARFGNSETARVGDWVIAIGNPFGLGGSVTAGIVSARNRDIAAGPYDDFIQTDAPINRGNSGGPLFNMDGEVIGVNSAIYSPTGGSVGIGFAIPSSLARDVIAQLRRFGETRRGWLGVRIQEVTEEIAESLGLAQAKGALIAGLTEGGPAAKAGMQNGDLVVLFDGKAVADSRALPRMVADTPVGKAVAVEVVRKGQRRSFMVTLGRLEEADEKVAAAEPPSAMPPVAKHQELTRLGLSLAPLTPDLRRRYTIATDVQGVVVTDVEADSPAGEKNIRSGDVIVEVAQEPVKTPDEVMQKVNAYARADKKVVLLLVNRAGALTFVAVRLGIS